MREHWSRQKQTNIFQRLTLTFIDSHRKSQRNWKLSSTTTRSSIYIGVQKIIYKLIKLLITCIVFKIKYTINILSCLLLPGQPMNRITQRRESLIILLQGCQAEGTLCGQYCQGLPIVNCTYMEQNELLIYFEITGFSSLKHIQKLRFQCLYLPWQKFWPIGFTLGAVVLFLDLGLLNSINHLIARHRQYFLTTDFATHIVPSYIIINCSNCTDNNTPLQLCIQKAECYKRIEKQP